MIKDRKMLILLFLSFILIAFFVLKFNLLSISKLNIEMKNVSCVSEKDLAVNTDLVGKNILTIDESKIENKVFSKYPCVKDIKMERSFSKSVKIMVAGRIPLASIDGFNLPSPLQLPSPESTSSTEAALLDWSFPQQKSKNYLVDDEGMVIGESEQSSLPILFWPVPNIKVGLILEKKLFGGVSQVLIKLAQAPFSDPSSGESGDVSNIKAKVIDNSLLIQRQLNNGSLQKLIFSLQKDILWQLASLQLILGKAKIDGRVMDVIDLRFDKPVVIYAPKKN